MYRVQHSSPTTAAKVQKLKIFAKENADSLSESKEKSLSGKESAYILGQYG